MIGPKNYTTRRSLCRPLKWYKCVLIKSILFLAVNEIEIEAFWKHRQPGKSWSPYNRLFLPSSLRIPSAGPSRHPSYIILSSQIISNYLKLYVCIYIYINILQILNIIIHIPLRSESRQKQGAPHPLILPASINSFGPTSYNSHASIATSKGSTEPTVSSFSAKRLEVGTRFIPINRPLLMKQIFWNKCWWDNVAPKKTAKKCKSLLWWCKYKEDISLETWNWTIRKKMKMIFNIESCEYSAMLQITSTSPW